MENLQSLGYFDIGFLIILSISILLGLIRGVIREVLSLVGLVTSIYLAFTFSEEFSKVFTDYIQDERICYIVAFALIIIGTLFFITLINLFFSSLLKASGLSFLNRIFGAVFGIIRGVVICSLLVMVFNLIPGVPNSKSFKESSFRPFFQRLTYKTFKYLPEDVSEYIQSGTQAVGKTAKELLGTEDINNNVAANDTNISASTADSIRLESLSGTSDTSTPSRPQSE